MSQNGKGIKTIISMSEHFPVESKDESKGELKKYFIKSVKPNVDFEMDSFESGTLRHESID
jgi:hypothetical protein